MAPGAAWRPALTGDGQSTCSKAESSAGAKTLRPKKHAVLRATSADRVKKT